jgi:hypothetical protein
MLRKVEARSREALIEAIGRALDAITSRDAKGFSSTADTGYWINRCDRRCSAWMEEREGRQSWCTDVIIALPGVGAAATVYRSFFSLFLIRKRCSRNVGWLCSCPGGTTIEVSPDPSD